jgi:hypothetical protein
MLYLDATINVMLPVTTHGHDSSIYIKKLGFTTPVTTSRPMACNRNARRPWWAGPRRRRAAAAGRWVGPAGARPGEERSGWRCAACALGPFGCMQYCNAILRTMVFLLNKLHAAENKGRCCASEPVDERTTSSDLLLRLPCPHTSTSCILLLRPQLTLQFIFFLFLINDHVWIHRLELVLASLSSTSHKVSKHEG